MPQALPQALLSGCSQQSTQQTQQTDETNDSKTPRNRLLFLIAAALWITANRVLLNPSGGSRHDPF